MTSFFFFDFANSHLPFKKYPFAQKYVWAWMYALVCSGVARRKKPRWITDIEKWFNSPLKGPVTRKMFPFGDVIMQKWFYKIIWLSTYPMRATNPLRRDIHSLAHSHWYYSCFDGQFTGDTGCWTQAVARMSGQLPVTGVSRGAFGHFLFERPVSGTTDGWLTAYSGH